MGGGGVSRSLLLPGMVISRVQGLTGKEGSPKRVCWGEAPLTCTPNTYHESFPRPGPLSL